jgi:hypothetical protein
MAKAKAAAPPIWAFPGIMGNAIVQWLHEVSVLAAYGGLNGPLQICKTWAIRTR